MTAINVAAILSASLSRAGLTASTLKRRPAFGCRDSGDPDAVFLHHLD
jgi:hypothetical protein